MVQRSAPNLHLDEAAMQSVSPATRVALVTGANTGIGKATASALAKNGYQVFLACRSRERTEPVLREIEAACAGRAQVEFLELDLADLASVRRCAQSFLERNLPLHLLVANAGLAGQKGQTRDGFELAFGTCHMGHFLLTRLLLPRLQESAPARVVVVSSKAHRHVKSIDFEAVRRPTASSNGLREYGVAKLANLLFARELGKRLEGTGVTTYSLHPGVVGTDVWRTLPRPLQWLLKRVFKSPEEGAKTSLYCATSFEASTQSGLYYENCRTQSPSPLAQNDSLSRALWDFSEQQLAI